MGQIGIFSGIADTRTLILLLLFVAGLTGELRAGEARLNSDSLFAVAREQAQNGQRHLAIQNCRLILQQSPRYHEVRVYMARVMAWEKEYNGAQKELVRVLKEDKSNKQALDALTDVLWWSGQVDKALAGVNMALHYYPNSATFLYKKARLLASLGRSREASPPLTRLLELDPAHAGGLELAGQIKNDLQMNGASFQYTYNYFQRRGESYGPWQLAAMEYARRTGLGSIFLRLNYADRNLGSQSFRGLQFEADAYPRMMKGMYAYLNFGYSGDNVFPAKRAGAELFKSLGWATEVSAGLRYLQWNSSHITIYTGSIGKYYKNYWFSFRPYISPKDVGTSFSGYLFIRRYFSDADNYLTLVYGRGSSPVEVAWKEELQRLGNQKIGLEIQKRITLSLLVRAIFDYEYEEYRVDTFGKRFNFSLKLQKRF